MLRISAVNTSVSIFFQLFKHYPRNSVKCRKNMTSQQMAPIKVALIDLSGTLHIEDQPTEGAVDALKKLRNLGVMVKFVTNTTKESVSSLHARLIKIGFQLEQSEIFSSLTAASNYVQSKELHPYYIVTDDARKDFPPNDTSEQHNAVVIGLAPEKFSYEYINEAFRILHQSKGTASLIAIHEGKFYKTTEGISVGPGCFVKGLEYSSGIKSICIGKPNEYFFRSALPPNIKAEDCIMIGDDPNDDCLGAMAIGMRGFLVETGKYQPELYEKDNLPKVSGIFKNFSAVVDHIAHARN
ncbi:haloacid dehalogenase-like hydrolase domain-containing protein 2 [Toxorhynchites rutilus septentrionalis]|uniref:haloacid dehalogenase-like hydrolase domain-containing protein 2 n=1 Tax=Toxorhynchites rutilus septentrionalis TaxID=329112 RepID=UPI00247A024A|nr:haloacid dehalogenase-like hydrolase domain-containing protein 2 [Toxorhynchites rutilus septentrionalis]